MAKFKNLLIEDINLKGEWRVVLTEITIPTHFYNVTPVRESPQIPSILGFKEKGMERATSLVIKNPVILVALSHKKFSAPTTLLISLLEFN